MRQAVTLTTTRLRLRCWTEADSDVFAALHADPVVMHDYGGPLGRSESDAKLDRYRRIYDENGFSRWAVERHDGDFVGYAGLTPAQPDDPFASHAQIGWRLLRSAWGHGYATEAARAALDDAFGRLKLREVIAFTAQDNVRSQAVMKRLGMVRDPSRDFMRDFAGLASWHGLVWVACPAARDPSGDDRLATERFSPWHHGIFR